MAELIKQIEDIQSEIKETEEQFSVSFGEIRTRDLFNVSQRTSKSIEVCRFS